MNRCSAPQRLGSSPLTRGKPHAAPHSAREQGLIPAHAGKTEIARAEDVNAKAHPRSRGENPDNDPAGMCSDGSSPLTRGKPGASAYAQIMWGLIPAHAGKTEALRAVVEAAAAHPRSRGENEWRAMRTSALTGSSPLTRGKPALGV